MDSLALPPIETTITPESLTALEQLPFHPQIKLLYGMSQEVKDGQGHPGEIVCNNFNFNKTLVIIVLDIRWHALYLENSKKIAESFHYHSEIFQSIKDTKRDYGEGRAPRWGLSFLCWIPQIKEFGVLHLNNPTLQRLGTRIFRYCQPKDQRDSDAERALPETRIMQLTGTILQNNFKTPTMIVQPLEELPEKFHDSGFSKEQLEKAIQIFQAPVLLEAEELKACNTSA